MRQSLSAGIATALLLSLPGPLVAAGRILTAPWDVDGIVLQQGWDYTYCCGDHSR